MFSRRIASRHLFWIFLCISGLCEEREHRCAPSNLGWEVNQVQPACHPTFQHAFSDSLQVLHLNHWISPLFVLDLSVYLRVCVRPEMICSDVSYDTNEMCKVSQHHSRCVSCATLAACARRQHIGQEWLGTTMNNVLSANCTNCISPFVLDLSMYLRVVCLLLGAKGQR